MANHRAANRPVGGWPPKLLIVVNPCRPPNHYPFTVCLIMAITRPSIRIWEKKPQLRKKFGGASLMCQKDNHAKKDYGKSIKVCMSSPSTACTATDTVRVGSCEGILLETGLKEPGPSILSFKKKLI
jgi:hypothetical protein